MCPSSTIWRGGDWRDAGDPCLGVDCLSFYVVWWRFVGVSAIFLDSDLHRLRFSARLLCMVYLCGCVAEWAIGWSRANLGSDSMDALPPPLWDLVAVSYALRGS